MESNEIKFEYLHIKTGKQKDVGKLHVDLIDPYSANLVFVGG